MAASAVFADAPGTTKSIRVVLADLNLERLFVVFPGERGFPLDEKTEAVPLTQLSKRLTGL